MAERPRRRRVLPIALGAAVLVAGVGGGLWYVKPWQGVDVPQSACWNAFTHDDLAALVGKGHKAVAWQDRNALTDREYSHDAACDVTWEDDNPLNHAVAKISTENRDEKFRQAKTKAESTGWEPIRPAPLDFGPGAQGWLFHEGTVQLLVRCDYLDTDGQPSGRPYRLVTITGDRWSSDTPVTEVHRIRIAAALRTARELVRAQGCTNDPQLAARAPAAPF
ncbi:hypothetical protein [Kitasatospora sp. NPDC006786]|uniref:hypothetical protein n=1 Tax=unclassified Kitasatospora TaxID=2633591 RepID=UPI0033EBAB54